MGRPLLTAEASEVLCLLVLFSGKKEDFSPRELVIVLLKEVKVILLKGFALTSVRVGRAH